MDDDFKKARAEVIELAKEEARQIWEDEGEGSTIHICQGPPTCDFYIDDDLSEDEQDKKLEEQQACPFCTRIEINDDGTETVTEPSRQ